MKRQYRQLTSGNVSFELSSAFQSASSRSVADHDLLENSGCAVLDRYMAHLLSFPAMNGLKTGAGLGGEMTM